MVPCTAMANAVGLEVRVRMLGDQVVVGLGSNSPGRGITSMKGLNTQPMKEKHTEFRHKIPL